MKINHGEIHCTFRPIAFSCS